MTSISQCQAPNDSYAKEAKLFLSLIESSNPLPIRKLAFPILAPNTASNKQMHFHCNLIHPQVSPALICPAFNLPQIPTVSNYDMICSNSAIIRLDPRAAELPWEIRPLTAGKEVDLFFTVIDGRPVKDNPTILLTTHRWVYGEALPGWEINRHFPMAIIPILGVQQSYEHGAIAFGPHLSPREVHMHLKKGNATAANMVYSPDYTPRFARDGLPFSLFWSLVQKDNRLAITKMFVIYDTEDPISKPLYACFRNCKHLHGLLGKLKDLETQLTGPIEAIYNQIKDRPIETLPLALQNEIFLQTWFLAGSPPDIHPNFGKASFCAYSDLDPQHHASPERKAQAIKQAILHLVCTEQSALLSQVRLERTSQELALMKTAQLFLEQKESGFGQLDQNLKNRTYEATWALNGYPRDKGDRYGQEQFDSSSPQDKAKALLLAASKL